MLLDSSLSFSFIFVYRASTYDIYRIKRSAIVIYRARVFRASSASQTFADTVESFAPSIRSAGTAVLPYAAISTTSCVITSPLDTMNRILHRS